MTERAETGGQDRSETKEGVRAPSLERYGQLMRIKHKAEHSASQAQVAARNLYAELDTLPPAKLKEQLGALAEYTSLARSLDMREEREFWEQEFALLPQIEALIPAAVEAFNTAHPFEEAEHARAIAAARAYPANILYEMASRGEKEISHESILRTVEAIVRTA